MSQTGKFFEGTPLPDVETLTGDVGGAVGPDGSFNIDIQGAGDIVVTGTPASNLLTISDIATPQDNIIYVGKHGNDANDGLSINKAKLTFGAAITAASANDTVWCFDDGTYTEDLTGVANISIYAPNATLAGSHTIITGNSWTFKELTVATGVTGVTMNTATEEASLTVEKITCTGTGIGVVCLAGKFFVNVQHAVLEDGNLIGATTADEVSMKFGEITISGTATAFSGVDGCSIQAMGNSVENTGLGNGQLFYTTGAGTPHIIAMISYVNLEKLSDITAGSIVGLTATDLNGSLNEAGAGVSDMGGATRIDGATIGEVTPRNGAFLELTASTSFKQPWIEVTGAAQAMDINRNYILNNAGLVTATLPATASVGDVIEVVGKGAGGWKIAQNAGQTIHFVATDTTTGVGGSLASTVRYDAVSLVCTTANTDFVVKSSVGNITVV